MPVSTRSHISTNQDEHDNHKAQTRAGLHRGDREEPQTALPAMRNAHHGLKEKMKALTVHYQQLGLARPHDKKRFTTHPSVDLLDSGRKCSIGGNSDEGTKKKVRSRIDGHNSTKENADPCVVKMEDEAEGRENSGYLDRIGFSTTMPPQIRQFPPVARKLSLPAEIPEEKTNLRVAKIGGELETVPEKCDAGSRILIFVRLRPMAKKEKEAGSHCCVQIPNKKDIYLTEFANENDYLRLKRLRGRHFTFDAALPESATQQEVYSTTTADLIEGVLQGRNGSVFCYGATGAGKTYTMLGTVENPGVMVLAIKDLFTKIRQRSCDGNHVVHLSYLEVYNETVRDLLSPGRPLVLREDKQGIVASGLTQYRAYSTDEVMALLLQGNKNRTTEPTRANETSSRSHAILQVVAEYKVKDSNKFVKRVGKLSLIDLAGSERALATDQRTLRSLEGANINRSLLALSSCINSLVEGKKHIPYRNSKLTQLLKDSLGGCCNTVMIANISPSSLTFGETQNTLHWADRAKEIRTKTSKVNIEEEAFAESDQAQLLLDVQKENGELRMQLARCQQKLMAAQAQSLAANAVASAPSVTNIAASPASARAKEKRRANSYTPGSRVASVTPNQEMSKMIETVKSLEAEMEQIKQEHALQIRQKDDFIKKLCKKIQNHEAQATESDVNDNNVKRKFGYNSSKHVLTRCCGPASAAVRTTRKKGAAKKDEDELKSPSQSRRFASPELTAKKRSFWDITNVNSPSMALIKGRNTRSHTAQPDPPSMLLQPGFTKQKIVHVGVR